MKLTKKLFALMMALCMVLSLGVVAFADEVVDEGNSEEENEYAVEKDAAPIVPKTYTVNKGTAPAETFTFTFTPVSYKNNEGDISKTTDEEGKEINDVSTIPAIDDVTITYAESNTVDWTAYQTVTADVDANDYELGVYTYEVKETANNIVGVTYDSNPIYLVLTVIRDEESNKHYFAAMHYETETGAKDEGFVNEYDSGSLSVTKQITGNSADMNKKFPFTIVFTAPAGKVVKSSITVDQPYTESDTVIYFGENTDTNAVYSAENNTLTYTIELGDDATITFANLPEGVTYTVSEEKGEYKDTWEWSDETNKLISAGDTDTVTVTNDKTNEIDTGISLDNIPYVLMLSVVAVGGAALSLKKRTSEK